MKKFFEIALKNIAKHGDTDIFPFPLENHLFFDRTKEAVETLLEIHRDLETFMGKYPPIHESLLAPISYTGFRWATQLDPFWNAYFLGCVLSIAEDIEKARTPLAQNIVFSYRYSYDEETNNLFLKDYGWLQFMQQSMRLAKEHKFVIVCDISEFYPRLGHHRLENALGHLNLQSDIPHRILKFLEHYSDTRSFGLPIGGPAARILSELVLDQIDKLLTGNGIRFCRFADDYHMFANSQEEAYAALIYLSEKLFRNQGLSLQKSKTRIMTSAEFISSSPVDDPDIAHEENHDGEPAENPVNTRSFLQLSLRFDPYSPTAFDDYELLKGKMKEFDIIGMLKSELSKSRIHTALGKKIATAVKFLESPQKNQAILSLMENLELLYPIFPTIMIVTHSIFEEIDEATQLECQNRIRSLITSKSHITRIDLNLAYAIRVLGRKHSPENSELLQILYTQRTASSVR